MMIKKKKKAIGKSRRKKGLNTCDTESTGLIPAPWHMVWLVHSAFAGSSGCSDQTQDPKQGCHIFCISRHILFFWNGALSTRFGCPAHPTVVGLSGWWGTPLGLCLHRSARQAQPQGMQLWRSFLKGVSASHSWPVSIWRVCVKGLSPTILFSKLPSVGGTKWPSRRDHPWWRSNFSKHRQEPCTETSLC